MVKHQEKFKLLSLFTGAGGLDIGFESTGKFETLAALECQPEYCATLRRNQAKGYMSAATIIEADIRELKARDIAKRCFSKGHIDGIVGGPPCEAFSVRGSKKGLSDPRGMLIYDFIRWIVELKPIFALMENVPPLATLANGTVVGELKRKLMEAGYSVSTAILNAAEYGAATRRQRFILLASYGITLSLPAPTHSERICLPGLDLSPAVTVSDALEGLPEPGPDESIYPTWHRRIEHTPAVVTRFSMLRPGQQDNIRKRTRLRLDKPSPAVVAGDFRGTRCHIHPSEPRELTNRESARLHGFSDDFEFCGSRNAVCKQIANSVPIPFARTLAKSISQQLSDSLERKNKNVAE